VSIADVSCNPGSPEVMIQRHVKSSPSNSFHRSWTEFKDGFCDSYGNFWIGNEKLHEATETHGRRRLRVELVDTSDQVRRDLWIFINNNNHLYSPIMVDSNG